MILTEAFDRIIYHTHCFDWAPDWEIAKNIYETNPNSYSILTPFAYAYLEELVRSMTDQYGIVMIKKYKNKNRKVGYGLIELAIEQNKSNGKLLELLEELKKYFTFSQPTDIGDNRNGVAHGYMHPRYWNKDSFETLIIDIARLSKFAGF